MRLFFPSFREKNGKRNAARNMSQGLAARAK
jgi:hypothetical protein